VGITAKTWIKLEAAERTVGIGGGNDPPAVAPAAPPAGSVEDRLARMEAALERLAAAVEALACTQKPLPTSSAAPGHDTRKKSA